MHTIFNISKHFNLIQLSHAYIELSQRSGEQGFVWKETEWTESQMASEER